MKKIFFFLIFLLVLSISQNVAAQSKKLLVFKKKVAVASGTIKGAETKIFYFRAKKDADTDISFDEDNKGAEFALFKPNGKPFYDENSVNPMWIYDILDVLPDAGIYKIAVRLPDNLKAENKPVNFTFRIVFR